MQKIFEKTLIIGASVSAAPQERNPARYFLKTVGTHSNAVVHAVSGRPGAHVLSTLKKSVLDQVNAVVAIDLFFWDSVFGLADPKESRARMRGLFNEIRARNLPIIVGDIPNFHPFQMHRDEMNEAIFSEAKRHERTRVLNLSGLLENVATKGVEIEGRIYSFDDLVPDGLHPGPIAARYIGNEIHTAAMTFLEFEQRSVC